MKILSAIWAVILLVYIPLTAIAIDLLVIFDVLNKSWALAGIAFVVVDGIIRCAKLTVTELTKKKDGSSNE